MLLVVLLLLSWCLLLLTSGSCWTLDVKLVDGNTGPGSKPASSDALTYKLGAAPDEGQELEVIQTPDPLAPSGLHPVGPLQLPHHLQVSGTTGRDWEVKAGSDPKYCLYQLQQEKI